MRMRQLGKTGIEVSEIGLGCEHLQGMAYEDAKAVVDAAIGCGINTLELFMSDPDVRTNIGRAIAGKRDQLVLQGHIGALWQDGQYKRSYDVELCNTFFEDFLTRYQTDYIDICMIHFIDEFKDLDAVLNGGLMDYALKLKKEGRVKCVGISSHNPQVALKAVKTGLIDALLFSMNPAYDLLPEDTDIDSLFKPDTYTNTTLMGTNPVRDELYKTCENMGVGITVMKAYGGGSLFTAEHSPLNMDLSAVQLLHYSLTRPAVASVMAGCKTVEEVKAAVAYETASDEEKDYSEVLGASNVYSATGLCMYCNHCLPCPSFIDIAQMNKYLDLALISKDVPATVAEHYGALEHSAADCIQCGACEPRCPFKVKIMDKMLEARTVFGE